MIEGQTRIDVDRMWRDPEWRKRFEVETGVSDEHTTQYQSGFIEWAIAQVARDDLARQLFEASGENGAWRYAPTDVRGRWLCLADIAISWRSPAAIERIEAVTGEQEPIAWQWHVGSDCWTPCEPPTEDELKDNPSKFRPLYLGRMPSAPACHEPHNSGGVDPLVTRDCAGAGTEVAALHREIVDRQAEIIRLRAQVEQLKSTAATEQSQRDYDHGYGVGYEHGIKEASAECKKLLGLVESATAWLDQEITRAADQQRQSYAMSGEHGQRQGERWHARQIALYEAKLKFTSTVVEKPTCKLCGLEDGACICRSIPSTERGK